MSGIAERVFGLALFALGLFIVYGSMKIEVAFTYDPLGPKSFPLALGALLSLCSLALIIKPDTGYKFASLGVNIKIVLIVFALFLYQAGFEYLGFLLATFLLCFFISLIFKATMPQAALGALGISSLVYALFALLLKVPLPLGILGGF